MTIVERLRKYLDQHQISNARVTEMTGIPSDRIRQWLKGNGNPKAADTQKIEKLLRSEPTEKVPEQYVREAESGYYSLDRSSDLIQSLKDQIQLQKEEIARLREESSMKGDLKELIKTARQMFNSASVPSQVAGTGPRLPIRRVEDFEQPALGTPRVQRHPGKPSKKSETGSSGKGKK